MAKPSFDYFEQPRQTLQTFPLSLYDTTADFSGDSTYSPESPLSPTFVNPYQLPISSDDWNKWDDKATLSPDLTKQEPFDTVNLAAIPTRATNIMDLSPGVDPIDLAGPMSDAVPFGGVGFSELDIQPLFQSPISPLSSQQYTTQKPSNNTSTRPQLPLTTTNPTTGTNDARNRHSSRKRKSSSSRTASSRSSPSPPPSLRRHSSPPKKTAHNMIEKRYRTNLNDKIAALRDSVPSLRVMVHRLEQGAEDMDEEPGEEDLGGLTPAHKLNKATILSKATEYIAHLEKRNQSLAKENDQLRNRVEGFEMLVVAPDSVPVPQSTVWA